MLISQLTDDLVEAGCDEAGRGCLAGPVFASAVILPAGFCNEEMNDSKKLPAEKRYKLREIIESVAISWAVASVTAAEIDEINILKASFLAMHMAIKKLAASPQLLLIDGNRFTPYPGIPHRCIVKGDTLYMSIAAASILAKTYRDDYMIKLHEEFPEYAWNRNKGYPTVRHREKIIQFGTSLHHRRSFNLIGQRQLPID